MLVVEISGGSRSIETRSVGVSGHIIHQDVTRFLKAALECSIYVEPTDPGLTYAELVEAASRADFREGEINDAILHVTTPYSGGGNNKLLPDKNDIVTLSFFTMEEEPEYRNPAAFHFVFHELRETSRSQGANNAKIERSVLVERGVSERLSRSDIQIAITILALNEILSAKNEIVSFARGKEGYGSPGDQANVQSPTLHRAPIGKEARARAYPIVKDIIDRRTDSRPASAEPLDAFAEQLEKLGHGVFRMWWRQLVSELRHTSIQVSPVSVTVLSAALVEGALTFVVKHGRSLGLGIFSSTDFDRPTSSWTVKDLELCPGSSCVPA